jgi:dynein heavy chain
MNPGYAGRTDLPDNLKVCFRPIVMVVPDLGNILEVISFSHGILKSRELNLKLITILKLSS